MTETAVRFRGFKYLGSRLTTYSSTLRMPEFFACILILAVTGITIYAFFFWVGKKLAGWES